MDIRQKAYERLCMMGVTFDETNRINENFLKKDKLYLSERNPLGGGTGLIFEISELSEYKEIIPVIENLKEEIKENNGVVYHVIITPMTFGTIAHICYMTNEDLDENGNDIEFHEFEYEGATTWQLMSYSYNLDTEETEYGSIGVQCRNGGLYQVF